MYQGCNSRGVFSKLFNFPLSTMWSRERSKTPLTGFLPSSAAASIYLFKTAIRHRASPEFIGSRKCVPMAFTAESPPAQGQ